MGISRFIAVYSPLSFARLFSPQVEMHSSGAIFFPVSQRYEKEVVDRLLNTGIENGPLHFGLASTRTVALLAARLKPGSRIPDSQTESFIRDFPIEHLFVVEPFCPDTLVTLKRWGIHRIGQLAKLPGPELAARLGEQGSRLLELARGKDIKPFQPLVDPARFIATEELQWEIDNLEPLTFLFGRLLEQLCRQLEDYGLATDRLDLRLQLTDSSQYQQSVPLAFPMRHPKLLLSLLRLSIQSQSPDHSISRVELEAHPCRPRFFQYSLLQPNRNHPEELSRTLSKLNALVGQSGAGIAAPEETHQPDRFQLASFSLLNHFSTDDAVTTKKMEKGPLRPALRRFRPPRSIELRTDRIVCCSGPWRSSGSWWKTGRKEPQEPEQTGFWSRDEWDIEMVDGRIYRIYWDFLKKKYFAEGIYD